MPLMKWALVIIKVPAFMYVLNEATIVLLEIRKYKHHMCGLDMTGNFSLITQVHVMLER